MTRAFLTGFAVSDGVIDLSDVITGITDAAVASIVATGELAGPALESRYVRTYRPEQFTGTTLAKINAAIDAASAVADPALGLFGRVRLSGDYVLPGTSDRIAMKTGVVIEGGTITAATNNGGVIEVGAVTDWRIEGVTIVALNAAYGVKVQTAGAERGRIVRCDISGPNITGVHCQNVEDIRVIDCTFSDVGSGMAARGSSNIRFLNSRVTDWLVYGVEVRATVAEGICDDIWVQGCHFSNVKSGETGAPGVAKQAVVALGFNTGLYNTNIHVDGNISIGSGAISIIGVDNDAMGDQYVMHNVRGFTFIGNTSKYGGENGVSITHACHDGIVAHNIVTDNDTHGIEIGLPGDVTAGSSDIIVTGNICKNNGIDAEHIVGGVSQRTDMANMWIVKAHNIILTDNDVTDTTGLAVPVNYGILVAATCTNITLANNDPTGCAIGINVPATVGVMRMSLTPTDSRFGSGAGTVKLSLHGGAGSTRMFGIRSGAVERWKFGADATAESGSDAGSKFVIEALSDAGAQLGNAVEITRATRQVKVLNELEVDGALNHDGSTVGFYGATPIAKQTGVAVTPEALHAALVALGLIGA